MISQWTLVQVSYLGVYRVDGSDVRSHLKADEIEPRQQTAAHQIMAGVIHRTLASTLGKAVIKIAALMEQPVLGSSKMTQGTVQPTQWPRVGGAILRSAVWTR